MTNKYKIIEKDQRLSKSKIWQLQRDYFDEQGIHAWSTHVPYFVTSNCFIARCYAEIVVRFMMDWTNRYPEAQKHPFYILELGTGTGQLSFYILKEIQELCAKLQLDRLKYKYIMTDFTANNLQFWQSHLALKPYIDEGLLDFAIYNMEENEPIHLINQNSTLSFEKLINPLIVFANYIFDTIAHDCFSVHKGTIQEVALTIKTNTQDAKNPTNLDFEQFKFEFNERKFKQPYYQEEVLNQILERYRANLKNAKILLPISSLKAIEHLRNLSRDRMFLISSDKGYNAFSELDDLDYPSISVHGSFSLMVNFDSICEYFKLNNGDYQLQSVRKGLKTCVFCSGMNFEQLPQTQLAIEQNIHQLSPADYFCLHQRMNETFQQAPLEAIVSHLVLSNYDAYVFNRLHERIIELLDDSDEQTLEHLHSCLAKIAQNFYFIPNGQDVLFKVAFTHQMLKKYSEACDYYHQSNRYFKKQFGSLYNLAICQHFNGNNQQALALFKEAQTMNPPDEYKQYTQDWIERLISDDSTKVQN